MSLKNSKALLSIRGLKTYYYTPEGVVKAVDEVDLDIKRGETVGLVGESGSGKSTLALSIMRLIPPPGKIVSGSILFDGEDLLEKSEEEMRKIRGGKISMIFQNPMTSLNPVFTIGGQITEVIKLHQNISKPDTKSKAVEILEKVGIYDASRRISNYPHEFSVGMRQRVMIAMALSSNPKFVIADEPTSALDVSIQAQILELITQLKKDFGFSVLFVTHNMGIVAELCDKVAVMYAGKLVEYSDKSTIITKPLHPYVSGLIRSIPRLRKDIEELYIIRGLVPDLTNLPHGCRFHPRCKYAKEICIKGEPSLIEIVSGHLVACFRAQAVK